MSEQTNQKEATYNAITSTLKSKNTSFEDGMDVKPILNSDSKKEIRNLSRLAREDAKLNIFFNTPMPTP